MSAYQFGWFDQPRTKDLGGLVLELNKRLRALVHDFDSGTIALTTRATVFVGAVTVPTPFVVRYDGTQYLTVSVGATGQTVLTASGTFPGIQVQPSFSVLGVGPNQVFVLYDFTHYLTVTVGAGGAVALAAVGAGAAFALSHALTIAAGGLTHADAKLLKTTAGFTNGAAGAAGTLLNAPAAGNPTKWIPVDDNGVTRYVPAW